MNVVVNGVELYFSWRRHSKCMMPNKSKGNITRNIFG